MKCEDCERDKATSIEVWGRKFYKEHPDPAPTCARHLRYDNGLRADRVSTLLDCQKATIAMLRRRLKLDAETADKEDRGAT